MFIACWCQAWTNADLLSFTNPKGHINPPSSPVYTEKNQKSVSLCLKIIKMANHQQAQCWLKDTFSLKFQGLSMICSQSYGLGDVFHNDWLNLAKSPTINQSIKSSFVKARYGGSNMKKINNGGRLLIFYMMEGIKKVNLKNGILWLFSVTDPLKSKMAAKFRWKTGWPGNARTQLLRMIAIRSKQF